MSYYYTCPQCKRKHKKNLWCIAQQANPWFDISGIEIRHKCICGSINTVSQ